MKNQTRKEVPCGPIVPHGALARALAQIPDPRRPFGWRPDHPPLPLVSLLLLTLAALMCGANSLAAVAQWGRERRDDHPDLLQRMGFLAGQSPSPTTLHRVYRQLDQQAVDRALLAWVKRLGLPAPTQVSVDGQTLRAVAAGGIPGSHLVSVFAPETRQVLAQVLVPNKGHEQAAMTQLREAVPTTDCTLTFDALHTHRAVGQFFEEAGTTFIAPVRGNQPILERDVAALFADWPVEQGAPPLWLQEEIRGAGGWIGEHIQATAKPTHGRLEWRRVCVWADPRWPTTLGLASEQGRPWSMVRQIVRVERHRAFMRQHRVIKHEHEIRYFIVNHPLPAATAAHQIRAHWGIENLLHRHRDVLFDQDRSTIRRGAAPIVLAALRNLLLLLLAQAQVPNAAAWRRSLAARPALAVSFLLRL